MALSFEEVNILGNIINDSFGKSSTKYAQYTPHDSNTSIVTKSSFEGNILTVVSLEIVNLIDYHYQRLCYQLNYALAQHNCTKNSFQTWSLPASGHCRHRKFCNVFTFCFE